MADTISNIFTFMVLAPLIFDCCVINIDESNYLKNIKKAYLWTNFFVFLLASWLLINFRTQETIFCNFGIVSLSINNISIYFVELTAFLFLLASAIALEENFASAKKSILYAAFIESTLLLFFATNNVYAFFIFFELASLPLLIFIHQTALVYGVFITSALSLFSAIYLTGITNISEITILLNYTFNLHEEKIIFTLFFITFIFKSVILPIYFWISDVEETVPQFLSVLLKGVIFNTGIYGIITVLQKIAPTMCANIHSTINVLSLGIMLFSMFFILRKLENKNNFFAGIFVFLMGLELLGAFSKNIYGISGAIFCLISFGISLPSLIFIVYLIRERNSEILELRRENSGFISLSAPTVFTIPLLAVTFFPLLPCFVGMFFIVYGQMVSSFTLALLLSLIIAVGSIFLLRHFAQYFLQNSTQYTIRLKKRHCGFLLFICCLLFTLEIFSSTITESVKSHVQKNLIPNRGIIL